MTLDLVLRRKGRVLDAMTEHLQAVRARLNADDRELLDQLDSTRAYLASLIVKGPSRDAAAYRTKVALLA